MRVLAIALAVLGVTSSVHAQASRVVVTRLAGRNAAVAQRAIVEALSERGLTVTASDAAPSDEAAAAAVARELGAEAIIGGDAGSRSGTWRVRLWIRDAAGGAQGEVVRRARGRRGLEQIAASLAEALEMVPTTASTGEAVVVASVPEPEPQPEPEAAVDPTPAAPSAPAIELPAPTREERASPATNSDAEAAPVQAWVLVGAGVRTRVLELLSPDGVDSGYRAEPYFEIAARAGARFFDVAFVRASFGSSIGLESAREEARLGTVETWFVRALGDVGASVVLDETVELGVAFGVGWDRYQLTFNELVPTAEYVHLRPALLSGFRLVGRALVLDAEVGVRVPLSVGDLEALHGVDHEVLGLDGVARLGGVVDPGFTWSLEVGARHYWIQFRRPDGDAVGFDAGWHATGYAGWRF